MNELNLNKITLNTKESCEYLSINRALLDSYRRCGLIRAIKVGRYFLYPVSELNDFVNQNIGKEITKDGLVFESMYHGKKEKKEQFKI